MIFYTIISRTRLAIEDGRRKRSAGSSSPRRFVDERPEESTTVRFCVTTVQEPGPDELASALVAAARHRVPFVEREGKNLARLLEQAAVEAALVLGARQARVFLDGELHTWGGGMGELRLRRLERGEKGAVRTRDTFLEAADLRPGDRVLDATLGLGMDALVAAGAVGEAGEVLGVEVSPLLAALVEEGLSRHPSPAARRVKVLASDAAAVLEELPESSVDVVVFDPMFEGPIAEGPLFELVRRLGDSRPLTSKTLRRARRVARRWVVVKDRAGGPTLARLGLSPLPGAAWAKRCYGRLAPADAPSL
jgi:16S rRNA (guanine1516-N2)-methyltransferase